MWTEADWLREFALLERDADSDPEEAEAKAAREEELRLAAAGDWQALGIDPPDSPENGGPERGAFEQTTIDHFLT